MNVLSFVINVFIGLWLVPYLVKHVGVAAYGLVPLAMIFTEYISVITVSINGTIARFLAIDIQENNWFCANRTFNTAFFALIGLISIQIPVLAYVIFDLDSIINIPQAIVSDVYYLFFFTFLGFFFSIFSTAFNTSMYANNRLDLSRAVDIVKILSRVISIVVLFQFIGPNLKYVGLANLVSGICTFLFSISYWKKLTPKLSISINSFEKDKLKELLGMGGWLSLNMVGYLLFLKIDLFVINRFLGAEATGEYSAVLQWNVLLRTLATVLSGVVGPMILISFAKKEISKVTSFAKYGVKFLSLAIGVSTGIICGVAAPLLELWLGPEFRYLSYLLVVMLFSLPINLGILPLFAINNALNKVKIPGVMTILMGILNLGLAILSVSVLDLGFLGVALAGAITLTLKNGIFTPWYAARVLGVEKYSFYKPLGVGVIIFGLAFLQTTAINNWYSVESWVSLIVVGFMVSLISTVIAWIFMIRREEKDIFLSYIPHRFKIFFHV